MKRLLSNGVRCDDLAVLLSLAPAKVDLEAYAGDGAIITIAAVDASNAPINLTGAVLAQVRLNRTDPGSPVASFAVDSSKATTGQLTLTLTGAQTAALVSGTSDPWRGYWDCQWTAAGAQPITLVQGHLACWPDVSH